jgi:hypothetical protein
MSAGGVEARWRLSFVDPSLPFGLKLADEGVVEAPGAEPSPQALHSDTSSPRPKQEE